MVHEKNGQIAALTQQLALVQHSPGAALGEEVKRLKVQLAGAEERIRRAKECQHAPPKEESADDMQRKMRKVLSQVYREIMCLSRAVTEFIKGGEPNMQILLGDCKEATMMGARPEDVELLSGAIRSIRTRLCDYYAEKYSSECGIQ